MNIKPPIEPMTPEQISLYFSEKAKKKWADKTPEQRSAFCKYMRITGLARKALRSKQEVNEDVQKAIKFGKLV